MTPLPTDRILENNIALLNKSLKDILLFGSVSDLNTARGMIEVRLAMLIFDDPKTRVDMLSA